jgi:hypothetical protein
MGRGLLLLRNDVAPRLTAHGKSICPGEFGNLRLHAGPKGRFDNSIIAPLSTTPVIES